MKTKLAILILLFISGITQAQTKITYSYDAQGNRILRRLCSECIVRKDPTKNAEPLSNDSLKLVAMGDASETNTGTVPKDEMENDILKTWIGHQEVDIYPNPTQGYLSVGLKNFTDITDCQLEIVDMNGRVVYNSTNKQRVYGVDLGSYPAGNYYINLRVNGRLGSFVIVKQ